MKAKKKVAKKKVSRKRTTPTLSEQVNSLKFELVTLQTEVKKRGKWQIIQNGLFLFLFLLMAWNNSSHLDAIIQLAENDKEIIKIIANMDSAMYDQVTAINEYLGQIDEILFGLAMAQQGNATIDVTCEIEEANHPPEFVMIDIEGA